MKKRVLIILLIVTSILLLLMVGVAFYINTIFPKMIFEKGVDKVYNLSDNILTKASNFDYENKIVNVNSNLSYILAPELKKSLKTNDISLNFDVTFDNQNKKMLNKIKYLEDDKEYVNIDLLYNNSEYSYINLNNLYNKILKVSLDKEDSKDINDLFDMVIDNRKTIKDTNRLIYLVSEIVKNNINKDDIVEKNINMTVDNKDYKLTEYFYTLEGEKLYNYILNILKEMEKNEEITKILTETYKMEEINLVEEFEKEKDYTKNLYVSIYTTGKYNIVGFSVNMVSEDKDMNLKYLNIEDHYLFELISDSEKIISLEGSKDNKGVINLIYENKSNKKINVSIKNDNDEYIIILEEPVSKSNVTIKYKYIKVSNEEELLNLELGMMTEGTSLGIIKYTQSAKVVDNLEEFDYSKAIDVNELTEEDKTSIQNNLLISLQNSLIINFFTNFNNNFENQIDDNLSF